MIYREQPIDASYQVLVYLTKVVSDEEILKKINQSKTRIACGNHVY
jgi:hypothetical protein